MSATAAIFTDEFERTCIECPICAGVVQVHRHGARLSATCLSAKCEEAAIVRALGDRGVGEVLAQLTGAAALPVQPSAETDVFTARGATPEVPRGRSVRTRPLGDYHPAPVHWLWRRRVPAGELTILAGDGGVGKSTFAAYLAALVTRGEITGLTGTRRALVVLGEDDPARVSYARHAAAGAVTANVHILAADDGAGDEPIILPDDLAAVRAVVDELKPDLLVIDPLTAHLNGTIDTFRDGGKGGMRGVLNPLARLAQTTGTTVLAVVHLNKGSGPAASRIAGTVALRNAARNVVIFATHPEARSRKDGAEGEDDGRRIIGHEKSNYGRRQTSLAATVSSVPALGRDGQPLVDKDGDVVTTSVLSVGDVSDVGYEQALAVAARGDSADEDEHHDVMAEAIDFLRVELADGPVPSRVLDRAAADAGISRRTIERARQTLGVKAIKTADGWVVALDGDSKTANPLDDGAVKTASSRVGLGGLGGLDVLGSETPITTENSKTASKTANDGVTSPKSAKTASPHAHARGPANALTADCADEGGQAR